MITSKQEAIDQANIRVGEAATSLIAAIEQKIKTQWVQSSRIFVYPSELLSADIKYANRLAIIDTVVGLYKSAGWEAKYETSQRDGDWIELK